MKETTIETSTVKSKPLETSEIVYASAVVKSKSGKSIFDKDVRMTLENVGDFDADPNKMNEAKQRLRKAGFALGGTRNPSITISAPAKVFNSVFKIEIVAIPQEQPDSPPLLTCKDSDLFGFIAPAQPYDLYLTTGKDADKAPKELKSIIIIEKDIDQLRFRIFDDQGKAVKIESKHDLSDRADEVTALIKDLNGLWEQGEIEQSKKGRILKSVMSVLRFSDDFYDILSGINLSQPLSSSNFTADENRPKEGDWITKEKIKKKLWKNWYLEPTPISRAHDVADKPPKNIADALNVRTKKGGDGVNVCIPDGAGVNVCIPDDGCYVDHPYFISQKLDSRISAWKYTGDYNKKFKETDENAGSQTQGHGTKAVAALLEVAPMANVLSLNVLGHLNWIEHLSSDEFTTATKLDPKVISISYGMIFNSKDKTGHFSELNLQYHQILKDTNNGIVYVCAMGNQGELMFPSITSEVIAVGGAFKNEKNVLEVSNAASGVNVRRTVSACFPLECQRLLREDGPDVCGLMGPISDPCYTMYPTTHGDGDNHDGKGWGLGIGTSFTAPQVAGVVALMKEVCSTISTDEIKMIFSKTCEPVMQGSSANGVKANGVQPKVIGEVRKKTEATGWGLVHAGEAVRLAQSLQSTKLELADKWTRQVASSDKQRNEQHTGRGRGQPLFKGSI